VVVNYAGRRDAAEAVVRHIEQGGGRATAVQADVGSLTEVARMFDAAFDAFGRPDVLVNNAVVILYKLLADTTEEEFDRLMATNVKGTYFCCLQAAGRMADGGRIINLSTSITGLMQPTDSAYAAGKGAVEQITRVLAKELGPRRITVNCLSPGPTDTELFGEGKSEEQTQAFGRMAALGRLGRPEDVADAVALLCGPDAGWVSGQTVRVNGGLI
jgi:3-oxoacyl-[acyl-carrier protein] reductase